MGQGAVERDWLVFLSLLQSTSKEAPTARFFQLGGSLNVAIDRQGKHMGMNHVARFIGGRTFKIRLVVRAGRFFRLQAQLFVQFTLQGLQGCFTWFQLATGLHVIGAATFADQKNLAFRVGDVGGSQQDDRMRHGFFKLKGVKPGSVQAGYFCTGSDGVSSRVLARSKYRVAKKPGINKPSRYQPKWLVSQAEAASDNHSMISARRLAWRVATLG